MRKLGIVGLLFLLLFSLGVLATENTPSVQTVLSEIVSSQGISTVNQIDCGKVSERQFEELGDALMEQMHPGAAHEAMDTMMGGEGSQSLKIAHVSMGKSYVRCINGTGIGQSGYGMMGPWMMQWATGPGYWQNSFYSANTVFWVVLFLLVTSVALNIYFFIRLREKK